MRECDWNNIKKENDEVMAFCKSRIKSDPILPFEDDANLTTSMHIEDDLRSGKVNGIVVCTLKVSDHLREYFKDFAPIIKHANINYEDIGPFMQNLASVSNIKVQNRRSVIDS